MVDDGGGDDVCPLVGARESPIGSHQSLSLTVKYQSVCSNGIGREFFVAVVSQCFCVLVFKAQSHGGGSWREHKRRYWSLGGEEANQDLLQISNLVSSESERDKHRALVARSATSKEISARTKWSPLVCQKQICANAECSLGLLFQLISPPLVTR